MTGFGHGDRVWADLFSHGAGAFAPFVCVPAVAFSPLPHDVAFADAGGVPYSGALALQAVTAGRGVSPGMRAGRANGGKVVLLDADAGPARGARW